MKQYAYVTGKLQRLYMQHRPWEWYPAYLHLMPLLSDHPELVSWSSQNCVSTWEKKDSSQHPAFHAYQAILALQGEWAELAERCERVLASPAGRMKKYQVDHRFYLSLAKADVAGMEAALSELTSPTVSKVRNFEPAFGLTERLISTFGVVYAKIASRHGYQLNLDTPWIPTDWLPMAPLDSYDEPYTFLRDFDLFTPFEGDWSDWSPVRS
ncbi:hypothetical protein [Chitinimonas naiadis]